MTSDLDRYEAAASARDGLVAKIAQMSARAAHDVGVEFDIDDTCVARWLILATFEGMFMPLAKRTSRELLEMAEKASDGEPRSASPKRKKGEPRRPIVTWDHLVAWADVDPQESSSSRRSKP